MRNGTDTSSSFYDDDDDDTTDEIYRYGVGRAGDVSVRAPKTRFSLLMTKKSTSRVPAPASTRRSGPSPPGNPRSHPEPSFSLLFPG